MADVTVLGPTTASKLFGAQRPDRADGDINGVPLDGGRRADTSVGSSGSATNEDDQAIVPLSTMAAADRRRRRTSVDTIYVEATSSATLSAAYQEADTLLLNLHGISAANADFTINSQQSLLSHRHLGGQDADRAARPGSPPSRCWSAGSG